MVGAGGITGSQLKAFHDFPDRVRLVAICDPNREARARRAGELAHHGDVQTFATHEQALAAMEDQLDAAIVCTPHFLHFPQALACVEAGVPVLVEKPVCNNVAELRQLHKAATARNVLVVAGQNRRYDLTALWLKRWLQKNPKDVGEVRSFDLRAWQNVEAWIATKPDRNADFWILDKERAGGGVVVSLAIHYLDMIRFLSGHDFVSVSARGRYDAPFRNGAESMCAGLLTLANGATGTLHANYLARKSLQPNEVFNIIFDQGYLGTERGWGYASTGGKAPDGWNWQFEGINEVPRDTSLAPSDNSFVNQCLAFADAVRTGRPPMSHLADNFNTMATIEALYASMQQDGRTVEVATL